MNTIKELLKCKSDPIYFIENYCNIELTKSQKTVIKLLDKRKNYEKY